MRCVLFSILLAALPGHAEEARLSIRTLAVEGGEIPAWHVAADGGTYQKLTWPVEQPSAAIVTTAGADLLLSAKADGEEFKVEKKLAVPQGADQCLLVAWPIDGEEKVGVMLVADPLKTAKQNDWLLINTSKHEVTLSYGSEGDPIRLEPGEAKAYQVAGEQDKGSAVIARMKLKGEMKTIYSTYWSAPENQRSLIVFYDSDGRVRVHRIIDELEAPEKPGE